MYPLAGPGLLAVRHTHLLGGSRAIGAEASIIHTGWGGRKGEMGSLFPSCFMGKVVG